MVLNLKRDIQDINRFKEIITIFCEEGLGHYLKKGKLRSKLHFLHQLKPCKPLSSKEKQALALRHAFERLGPTFVKLGQLLSLRPDLVPKEYTKEFEKLQDQVPSFSFKEVKKTIEEDLQQPLEKLFKSFDKKPIASASVSQVHKAVLKSGKVVAVKIRRPSIIETINADLDILFFIANSIEKHLQKARNYRPVAIVKEFALWTRKELNFLNELDNAKLLKDNLKDNKQVFVPNTYSDFSSERILTMDFVEGVKIDDFTKLNKLKINRKKVAFNYFTSILEQAFIHGFFHADPHPANIFVRRNGSLIYLDYGIMGSLDERDRKNIIKFIKSVPEGNADRSFNILLSFARDTSNANLDKFKEEALPVLSEVYHGGTKSIGKGFYEVISLGGKHGVVFDSSHVLMAKSVYQAEGLGKKLDPKFKVSEGLKTFSDIYLKNEISLSKTMGKFTDSLSKQKDLLLELPNHVSKIIERLETPSKEPHCEVQHLERMREKIERKHQKQTEIILVGIVVLLVIFLLYLEGHRSLLGLPLSVVTAISGLILLITFIYINKKD